MAGLKYNILFKVGAIIVIAILLLIPTTMIHSLINERKSTQEAAIEEVSSKWSEAQTITGPYLSIPYYKYVKERSQKDSVDRLIKVKDYITVLPNSLDITGNIDPEKRNRGIYEIAVYNSTLHIRGTIDALDFALLDVPSREIQLDKAEFVMGITDLRGIEKQVVLNWNDKEFFFNPGVSAQNVISSGINAKLDTLRQDNQYKFELALDLKGSQKIYFTPVGKVSNVSIASPWTTPSFNGAFLPDSRSISESGFTAKWNILHLNRNYPQVWTGDQFSIEPSTFGIDLLLPVDNYLKSYRALKYAILFIGFTFLAFFFIEVLNKIFIHPIQYILVGVALVVFYSLLIAISEHLSFNLAFIISSLSTLLLIAGYVKAVIKINRLVLVITGILFILYSFIFVIIQLEDYALLIGSIGIFIILGLVMYYSRKIDWYNLSLKENQEK